MKIIDIGCHIIFGYVQDSVESYILIRGYTNQLYKSIGKCSRWFFFGGRSITWVIMLLEKSK
jgi:hypothetical protein